MDFVWSADSAGMTNPMTTTGDTIYSSSGSTPARLGIGSTGQVLTVSGGVPAWATPAAAGGMTSIASGSLSGNSLNLTSISQSYKQLRLVLTDFYTDTRCNLQITVNGDSSSVYASAGLRGLWDGTTQTVSAYSAIGYSSSYAWIGNGANVFPSNDKNTAIIDFPDYASTSTWKVWNEYYSIRNNTSYWNYGYCLDEYHPSTPAAISSIKIQVESTNNFSGGTYTLYGVS